MFFQYHTIGHNYTHRLNINITISECLIGFDSLRHKASIHSNIIKPSFTQILTIHLLKHKAFTLKKQVKITFFFNYERNDQLFINSLANVPELLSTNYCALVKLIPPPPTHNHTLLLKN